MHVHGKSVRAPADHIELAPIRAVYQGIAGAFGEEAVRLVWDGRAKAIPARSFDAALEQLVDGRVEWAVIPVWNSTIGPVTAACAALSARGSRIIVTRELELSVRHCLLTLPGTSISDVRYVGSHPAALAQCARFFAEHPEFTACEGFDTAGAACELAMFREPDAPRVAEAWYAPLRVDTPSRLAVIASANAGRRYGLSILLEGVQDDATNLTRFVVVKAAEPRTW